MENNTGLNLEVKFTVHVTAEDIDDIIRTAFEGGICYWCDEVEVVGKYLGKYASEQISRGGKLVLYDVESSDKWELTLDKFAKGLKEWLSWNPDFTTDGGIDTANVDANCADEIIQYALFGELMFA